MLRHAVATLVGTLTLTLACASPPRSVSIPDLETRLERLTEELEKQRTALHVPGMALAIVKDDELVYARGFGLADVEDEVPVTPETIFAIGSTTKAMTATCIGMLVDEGEMRWDDPVTRHLPAFDLAVREGEHRGTVTIRDLLSHRTGYTRMGVLWAAGTTDRDTILETALRAEPWAGFREAFFYNNVMVLAAGEASARAAGTSWDDLVRRRLFEPLRMADATTSITDAQRDPRLALGYRWDEEAEELQRLPMRNLDSIAPAGAVNAHVLDMAQWVRLLLGRGAFEGERLVSSRRIRDTWQAQIPLGPGVSYGLGWFLSEWKDQLVVEHGGNIDGFSAEVALLPESDIGLVLLTNLSSTPLQQTVRAMVWEALLGEPLVEPDPAADTARAEESFDDYLGEYVADFGPFDETTFTVLVQNERLAVDIPGQMTFELLPPDRDGKRPFAITPQGIQVSFERNDEGTVSTLLLHQTGLAFEVPRKGVARVPDGTREDFARYLGTFAHPGIERPIEILFANGRVACDVPGQMAYELRLPDEDGVWRFRATDELGIAFDEDAQGRVASLTFHERGPETSCPRVEEGRSTLPTIEEVLALRGTDTFQEWLARTGPVRLSGTIRFANSGVEGTITVTFDGEGRFRQETDFPPFGWSREGFDGENGWAVSAFEPHERLAGKLLLQLRQEHPAAKFGDWTAWFDRRDVVRAAELGGEPHWVVRLQRGALPPWYAYVAAEDGRLSRIDAESLLRPTGTVPKKVHFADPTDVNGFAVPLRVTTETVAAGRVIVTYDRTETGVEVPEGFFGDADLVQ